MQSRSTIGSIAGQSQDRKRSMGLALELARRSVGLRYDTLAPDVVRWAKAAIAPAR